MSKWLLQWFLVLVLFAGCARLPADFESLPMERQVQTYIEYLQRGGKPLIEAAARISLHGEPAANYVAGYLKTRDGLAPSEAIEIIWDVQLRGCDLRGTPAEAALEEFVKSNKSYPEVIAAARSALRSIAQNRHSEPGRLDRFGAGACGNANSVAHPTRSNNDSVNYAFDAASKPPPQR